VGSDALQHSENGVVVNRPQPSRPLGALRSSTPPVTKTCIQSARGLLPLVEEGHRQGPLRIPMHAEFDPREEDFVAVATVLSEEAESKVAGRPRSRWWAWAFILFLGIFGAVESFRSGQGWLTPALILAAGIGILLVYLNRKPIYLAWLNSQARRSFRRQAESLGRFRLSLLPEGLEVEFAQGKKVVSWATFSKILVNDNYAFFIHSNGSANWLPGRAFAKATDFEAFMNQARAYHTSARGESVQRRADQGGDTRIQGGL
jgi:hypothetical protein